MEYMYIHETLQVVKSYQDNVSGTKKTSGYLLFEFTSLAKNPRSVMLVSGS